MSDTLLLRNQARAGYGDNNERLNGAPRVWAEKNIFCAQNTDETATRL